MIRDETKQGDNNEANMAAKPYVTDDPPLGDDFLTNALLKEMIAPKVKGTDGIDDDGLPKVVTDHKICWPFKNCMHKGWHLHTVRRIMAYGTGLNSDCCKEQHRTAIHSKYLEAYGQLLIGTPETLKSALEIYRFVLDIEISNVSIFSTETDTFLRSIAMTNVGILLSVSNLSLQQTQPTTHTNSCLYGYIPYLWMKFPKLLKVSPLSINAKHMRGEREAVLYFKIGALGYKIPFCKYLYGHALIHGTGGIKKNIPKGMGLLHDAANELHIAEAFFELGSIYERGLMGNFNECIAKDYAMAREFYEASFQASKENQGDAFGCVWVPEIGMINRLLRIDNIHLEEDALQNLAGMHYSWIILGHSFLFATAATLASGSQPFHYSLLLFFIPLLGILLAYYSYLDSYFALGVISRNQEDVDLMVQRKFHAYTLILEQAQHHGSKDDDLSNEQKRCLKEKEDVICRFVNHHMLAYWQIFISFFIGCIWALLLVNEIYSRYFECSYWFYTCKLPPYE